LFIIEDPLFIANQIVVFLYIDPFASGYIIQWLGVSIKCGVEDRLTFTRRVSPLGTRLSPPPSLDLIFGNAFKYLAGLPIALKPVITLVAVYLASARYKHFRKCGSISETATWDLSHWTECEAVLVQLALGTSGIQSH
jgi:hypothetical protein